VTLVAKRVSIFKSDNPEFNHKAAQDAYDLVMKMDEEEARLFTTTVVGDATADLIQKNLGLFQRNLDRTVEKRLVRIKKALMDTVVSKRDSVDEEQALAAAGALAVIEKAYRNPYDYGYTFDENRVRRNAKGQFTLKVDQTPKKAKALSSKDAERQGIPRRSAPVASR